jgi:protein TonB
LTGLDEQKPSRRLWISAAVIALALHVGGAALAIAHLQTEESDDALGASAIEIGFELASTRHEPTDLPPGPETDAAAPSPPLPEQKAEVRESELPQDRPTELEEADRIVTPNESKKPKEDDPKIAAVQTEASPEQEAQVATAMPTLDGRLNDKTTAPKLGIGKSAELAKVSWEKKLIAHFKKHITFPEGTKIQGTTVTLALEFDRLGHVVSVSIAEGSGLKAYDEAALKMVRRSDPVPVPPPLVADQGLRRTLPVTFKDPK